jgi:cytochrome P450
MAGSQGQIGSARTVRGAASMPRASAFEMLHQTLRYRYETLDIVNRLHRRYGSVVFQRTALIPMVSLFGPQANEYVLLDKEQIFSARRAWDLIMGRIFPNGLLLRDGADHRHHRRIMRTAFNTAALRDYVDQMNPHIERIVGAWRDEPSMLAFTSFKKLTLELACRIFLGIELGPEAERLNESFEATVAASMSIVRLRIPGLEFDRGMRGREFMMDFFGSMIPRKRAAGAPDLFSRLCRAESEEGERYDDGEIVDHLIFLMMAAHDTTTSTLTSMLYELGRHPAWQDRLRDECRSFAEDALSHDQLVQLSTADLLLQETLRRYPPLSTIPRVSERAFEFGGYEIPANTMVVTYPIHTHHMPEHWTDPMRFDPERFAPGRAEHERHPYQFVPFGGGAHLCIGYRFAQLQIKAVLYQLVRRYRWSLPSGYEMPLQQAPISKPRDGLPVRLEPIG